MKLKIAICDDDANQRDYLVGITAAWAGRMRHLAQVRIYSRAEDFLFDYGEEKDFDILLLDVEMPGMSGVELAKQIRLENKTLQIVFITGYYEYFSDGFDVSALHYLLKPVDEEKLSPVLDRAADNLFSRQRCVLVADKDGSSKVSLADIVYIESENVHIVIHTLQGVYRMRMALGKFSEQLDETFFKVHRSFVVNLSHIRKITRSEITMANGDLVPMSRGMYGEIYGALAKYL
ncbi:LytTR family DNA-binding domain-containing protein [uncultured Acetatifactor sp.]|jgi:DNA-binding LytR/AlgR family response regulator|uniref:LytR/AlgR family response regulator transcription factor n=1 Tax=uncultured Acetatifactor sp. TaxID=1671927 RepID=UPI00261B5BAF|nr:LytTR family DNA-binding domain-containing protein [uncultured Acetatifactor sp.]